MVGPPERGLGLAVGGSSFSTSFSWCSMAPPAPPPLLGVAVVFGVGSPLGEVVFFC